MTYIKQKQTGLLLITAAAEILIFLLYAVFGGSIKEERQFRGEEIPFYEDTEHVPEQAISLRRGSYRIRINYKTKNDAYAKAVMNKSYGRDFGDVFRMGTEDTKKTVELISFSDMSQFYIMSEEETLRVKSMTIESTNAYHRMMCVLLAALIFCADLFYWQKKKHIWENLSAQNKMTVLGVLLIAAVSSIPLFTNYLISGTDDLHFHLMRIEGLAEGLREGSFPVKMQPLWVNNHGYPVSIMYGDLFLYLPAALRLIGFPLQTVYKIYVFLVNLLTAVFAYHCGKKISGSFKTGLVCSLLYTLCAYRLMDLYCRSALGEFTAMMFLPLVFLGLHQLFCESEKEERRKSCLLLIAAYTGILESHLLGFLMAVSFSALYCLIHAKMFFRRLFELLEAAVITILLNLWFLVPLIDYMRTQNMHPIDAERFHLQEWGLFIPQLFQMFSFTTENHGYFTVESGILTERPMGVGAAFGLIFILFLIEHFVRLKKLKETDERSAFKEQNRIFALFALCILMTCYFFPWSLIEQIPMVGSLLAPYQFGWRFGMMGAVFGLFLTAYVLKNLHTFVSRETERIVIAFVCAFALLPAFYCMEARLAGTSPLKVTSAAGLDTRLAVANGEYLLENTDAVLIGADEPQADEGIVIEHYSKKNGVITISFQNTMNRTAYIKVPFFAYKGYHAADTKTGYGLTLLSDYQNVIMVMIPEGYSGEFQVFFKEPKNWRQAEAVSVGMLAILITVVLLMRKKKIVRHRKEQEKVFYG